LLKNFLYDDRSLLIEIRTGNIKAFEVLYNKYADKLYFFLFGYTKSHPETEEILQNIFLAVWENRSNLNESYNLKNYLYTIAVNKAFNYLKHKAIHQAYSGYFSVAENDHDNHTEKELLFNELKENIENILDSMPDQQSRIFRMSRFDGYNNKEIATRLGISVRTVENQIYRALQILREKLSQKYSF
jgi:RNA polymerase sigma-70 factor (ECF subfamily)